MAVGHTHRMVCVCVCVLTTMRPVALTELTPPHRLPDISEHTKTSQRESAFVFTQCWC